MADYDYSDISEVSSYADARADTPTLDGEHGSDSEDTLSNLSLDELDNPGLEEEVLVPPPIPAPRKDRTQEQQDDQDQGAGGGGLSTSSTSTSFASALNGSVRVCVTDADLEMADSLTLDLPVGAQYLPTSVDFARSPSQLKALKGPSFMPKEEAGVVSEDEESSVSSYQAQLDLSGQVRLTKKELKQNNSTQFGNKYNKDLKPNFVIPKINFEQSHQEIPPTSQDESYLSVPHDENALDDYIEDFILPMSHESVMSRQLSFRRKVQKTYDQIASDKASQELDKFEAMLSTYDEEDEHNRSLTPDLKNNPKFQVPPPVPKVRSSILTQNESAPKLQYVAEHNEAEQLKPNFDLEPQSLFDIDAIVKENAPNLMGSMRKGSDVSITSSGTLSNVGSPPIGGHGGSELESLSNYFLPQQTIDKLHAVYESSNFNNIYCLSGEIKNILSPLEIEEILENKDQLGRFIDPNVMAALSWSMSMNPVSLPPNKPSSSGENHSSPVNEKVEQDDGSNGGLKSKSSSMSNGFHSDASSEDDSHSTASSSGINSNSTTDRKSQEPRGGDFDDEGQNGGSESGIESPTSDSPTSLQRNTPLTNSMRRKIAVSKGIRTPSLNGDPQDDMDEIDLGVGDEDWEEDSPNGRTVSSNSQTEGTCLIRRDSKRFSFKGKDGQVMDRVVEGLFVESMNSNPKGTLRRVKLPLNLTSDDTSDELEMSSPEPTSLVKVGDGVNCDQGESNPEVKGHKQHNRRKISVDENILSMISSTEFDDGGGDVSQATNATQSDIFYSIRNSTLNDEDPTMRTENGVDDEITLDIDTPDDMEDSIMGQLESIATGGGPDPIPPLPMDPPDNDSSIRWKPYRIGPADVQIDLQAIQPYRKCLSHGGYFDAEKNVAIILFSGCYLPDRTQTDYTYLMDHLFLYVLSTLEELIVEDYILVYLHGATPKSCVPTYGWLKKCYQLINHRLRKNLKGLYLVHPTFWLRTVVAITRPFVSSKFSRKVRFIYTLSDLCLEIPTEHLVIPDSVLQYDFDLKVDDLKKKKLLS